jgi:membrane protease YdiL (CAAX protease family)
MEAKKIALKTVVISIGAVLITEVLFRPAVSALSASPLPGIGITRMAEIVLLILIVVQFEKSTGAIGLTPGEMFSGFKKGMIWSACFGIAAIVLFVLLYMAGINALGMLYSPLPHPKLLFLIYLLVGGVIAPVAEEIFFRGILYGFFRQWGVYIAVALSTLLFVLPHLTGGNLPFTQIAGGVVFAIAYEREQSLLVPITIHCLGNLAIFSTGLLA